MQTRALAGRVVAVTGGANGIGRETARRLALAGARVALGDLDPAAARASAEELRGDVVGFGLDVTDSASFTAFLAEVEEHWGPLDVLVNNAGVMWVGGFADEPESATTRQLEVNLHGVIRGVKLTAPAMRARGRGHIVTIASAASKLSPPGESTYAATKHGVYGYLKGVRAELRGSGVRISVVMPGVVDTELAAGTATGAAKLLKPLDVARAVVAVIERPRFEVSLPGYVGPLSRWVEVFPQPVRDLLLRAMVPDQVRSVPGASVRQGYESRIFTGTSTGTGTSTSTTPGGEHD
ncbi:SDR family NAD(P)-dependent oxidoreductase [Streptomyces diacarni]|uniref:SDR family NAD(P)-dependent oxidoreductase n=1 Tax=Streptomyces diacarni TaxID=2800381 RepID=A0A367EVM1_9ACTN|nr:SDR family oxidoreductase [Streptomyces diacarni]RCG21210.1 SDR family NAD(P)-dependent oxidoreductase [Streptomyces diacarni]